MKRQELQQEIEKEIKKETGQEVEITFYGDHNISMIGTVNAVRIAHTQLLSMVDTLTFESQETYEVDNEEVIFYTF